MEIVTIKVVVGEASKQQLDTILHQRKLDISKYVSECLHNLLTGTLHSPLMVQPRYADEELYPHEEDSPNLPISDDGDLSS